MSIANIQNELIEDFALFENWEDKYAYIIELGKNLQPLADEYKTETFKIKGCQSNVWVHSAIEKDEMQQDKMHIWGDSDAVIVKGLVALLIKILDQHTPKEVAEADLFFAEKIGINQHLSMTRANGLSSMIKQIKLNALAYMMRG